MTAPATRSEARTALLAGLAVAVTMFLWASAFVGIRHLGHDFSPGALSLGRLLVGTVCLGVVALVRPWVRPTGREWAAMAGIGVLWFAIYNLALNAGERLVDAGTASMLLQVSPVLIAALATWFLGDHFTATLGAGLALAFAGVVLIGFSQPGGRDGSLLGAMLCVLCAVVYSVSVILQKPLMARLPAAQVTWIACAVGGLCCLPFAPQLLRQAQDAPWQSVAWLTYLGAFPTAIAFTTYAYALRHMPASRLGVTTYIVPPITIVLGWLLLGEVPPLLAYAGGALALLGVSIARRRPAKP
ncbi:MAG: DMT family transporter, partial [Nocardioides sp.]